MEIYDSTPKNWATKKRSQRFSDPKEKRKAHPNGHPLRKVIYDSLHTKSSEEFSFTKSVRDPSGLHPQCPTPFERALNIPMVNDKNYSLNKHKNWEKVNEVLLSIEADDRYLLEPGKSDSQNYSRNSETETYRLGYCNMDEMKEEYSRQLHQQRKYDQTLDYNVHDLDNYIHDRFYDTILRKEHHYRQKHWKELQMMKPQNIRKEASFIAIKSITTSSIGSGCRLQSATTRSFGRRCVWSPRRDDDSRDFIQIDLGKNCLVEAISTRGRALVRNHEFEIDFKKSKVEFVKKYKVFIREDDGENVRFRKRTKIEFTTNQSEDDTWTPLGVFMGNKDSETEVANLLKLGNSNKVGVVCRYIRVVPLSLTEGGFHGRKSMRIGVYGDAQYEKKRKTKKTGLDGDETKKEDVEMQKGNGQLINNKSVPAAIITIKMPSEKQKRNCWAVNHRAQGVNSCSCYSCKFWKHDERKLRRGRRSKFNAKAAKLRHVEDYGLDHEMMELYAY